MTVLVEDLVLSTGTISTSDCSISSWSLSGVAISDFTLFWASASAFCCYITVLMMLMTGGLSYRPALLNLATLLLLLRALSPPSLSLRMWS
jgi:hypothetical protein